MGQLSVSIHVTNQEGEQIKETCGKSALLYIALFTLPIFQNTTIDPVWQSNRGIGSGHVGGLYQCVYVCVRVSVCACTNERFCFLEVRGMGGWWCWWCVEVESETLGERVFDPRCLNQGREMGVKDFEF